jgi:hypothetical protein
LYQWWQVRALDVRLRSDHNRKKKGRRTAQAR